LPALLLPEEEYPVGGRWWEKTPIGGGRNSFQIPSKPYKYEPNTVFKNHFKRYVLYTIINDF